MILQFLINGLISGALIAIMAIGFWFIYRSTNLFHIAHGAVYTASVYIFYTHRLNLRFKEGDSIGLNLVVKLMD